MEYFKNLHLKEKFIYSILFLFPLAGPVVEHWNSSIFVLVSLVAFYKPFNNTPLYKEEKIILSAFLGFFLIFILSSLNYGWDRLSSQEMGNEIYFLFFIPLYLMIRKYDWSKEIFFRGLFWGILVIFAYSVYEYIWTETIQDKGGLWGPYSKLFLGPVTALMTVLLYFSYSHSGLKVQPKWLLIIFFIMGSLVVTFSYSRTGYITYVAGFIALIMLVQKTWKQKIYWLSTLILLLFFLAQISSVDNVTEKAINNISIYFSKKNDIQDTSKMTSAGTRLELWRSAQYVFNEYPLFGIGNYHYQNFIKKYVDEKLVNEKVLNYPQLHNTYIELLVSKGIIGLLFFLIILYYPVYVAWVHRAKGRDCFLVVTTYAVLISAMSTGESNIINKNNAISIFIMFTIILFSWLMREIYREK